MINEIPVATETQEQIALVEWCALTDIPYTPTLISNGNGIEWSKRRKIYDYLFHIPNQGKRSLRLGYEFTKLGLKKGMPDLMLAYPRVKTPYIFSPGLFIEMKRRAKSVIHPAQKEMIELLEMVGYKCVIAYGWEEGRDAILEYLG